MMVVCIAAVSMVDVESARAWAGDALAGTRAEVSDAWEESGAPGALADAGSQISDALEGSGVTDALANAHSSIVEAYHSAMGVDIAVPAPGRCDGAHKFALACDLPMTQSMMSAHGCSWTFTRPCFECCMPTESCEPNPAAVCTREYMPMCGKDGVTYSNRCLAIAGCQPDAALGPCATPAPAAAAAAVAAEEQSEEEEEREEEELTSELTAELGAELAAAPKFFASSTPYLMFLFLLGVGIFAPYLAATLSRSTRAEATAGGGTNDGLAML